MNFKKKFAFLSAAVMLFSVVGCNENDKDKNKKKKSEESSVSESSTVSENGNSENSSDSEAENQQTSNADVTINLKLNSSWQSGGATTYDYTVTLKNNTDAPCTAWKAYIPVTDGSSMVSGWSMSYTLENGKVTVTPENYNSTIEAKSSVEFGFQMTSSEEIKADSITISAEKGSVSSSAGSDSNNTNNNNNNSNNSANNNANTGTDKIESVNAKEVPEPTTDDWLSTDGNKIIDSDGKEVWLTGCNWFGYNTGTNCFDGLWACDLDASLASIADHGFNLLRIPISTELVNNWEDGEYPDANYTNATNAYLNGMNSLEIFDHVIGQCRANGIKIMIDFHCAVTDAMGHNKPLWTDGDITEDDYFRALEWIAERYKNDDTIIAIDLENEPHG